MYLACAHGQKASVKLRRGHESERVKAVGIQLLQSKIDTYRYWSFGADAMLRLTVAAGAVTAGLELLLLLLLHEFVLSVGGAVALSLALDSLSFLVGRSSVVHKSARPTAFVVTGRYLAANRVCLCVYQCLPFHFELLLCGRACTHCELLLSLLDVDVQCLQILDDALRLSLACAVSSHRALVVVAVGALRRQLDLSDRLYLVSIELGLRLDALLLLPLLLEP